MSNGTPSGAPGRAVLESLEKATEREFQSNKTILGFDEYLSVLGENPERQLRGSARYTADMMDFFGREELPRIAESGSPPIFRFGVFDQPSDGSRRVVGLETVQTQIYRTLRAFERQGQNNRMLLLHGPNGSAKSSLVHALMHGLESYSRTSEGALYSFNWVFPLDKITKGGIGLGGASGRPESLSSFARLPDEEVAARLSCELRDHPLLLIPLKERHAFLRSFLGDKRADEIWKSLSLHLKRGELCHRCKQIAEALLVSHQGNLRRMLMHVQVERHFFSRRYRKGLVTIEPQLHVDAHYQQLTMNKSISQLPAALHGLNLFSVSGDLIDGNRGIIEFSDLLKRPVDSFKYILGLCETQSVNIGPSIAYIDALFIGSANEVQLDAFKEFPDFTSFKARMSLIRVPYLLEVRSEAEIYREIADQGAGDKHVAPHATWTAALWAVLTRLKKPNGVNYSPNVSQLVSNLTPLEKAKLYDSGELPASFGAEDRKLMRSHLQKIRDEYETVPYYEGRLGASAREMKSILLDAAQNPEFPCLSPLAVLREMEGFVKRVSEHEFLKQDIKEGYHDAAEFITTVRNEYLNRLDSEVRESIGLYDSRQWEEFIRKYVQHLAIALKKEKVKNSITGKMEDPDLSLIEEFERIVDAPGRQNSESDELKNFRQNIISQVGAWSLDHPTAAVVYGKVFPEYWQKLEKHYYESQKAVLTKLHDVLLVYGKDGHDPESKKLAQDTIRNMTERLGYCEKCSKEVITFLLKSRY
ncbi:MAG: serine protein kinase PrkA [Oligoflexia bacterium]|jgi:serine protein kinase